MKFGIHTQPTQKTVDIRWLGQQLETYGFESLFFPDHTYLPAHLKIRKNQVGQNGPVVCTTL